MTITRAMSVSPYPQLCLSLIGAGVLLSVLLVSDAFAASTAASPPNAHASPQKLQALQRTIASQIVRCWSPPPGASESGVKVTLQIKLNQDGTLDGDPVVLIVTNVSQPQAPTIINSVRRAVKMCATGGPFKMPADDYAIWSKLIITFDPGNL